MEDVAAAQKVAVRSVVEEAKAFAQVSPLVQHAISGKSELETPNEVHAKSSNFPHDLGRAKDYGDILGTKNVIEMTAAAVVMTNSPTVDIKRARCSSSRGSSSEDEHQKNDCDGDMVMHMTQPCLTNLTAEAEPE